MLQEDIDIGSAIATCALRMDGHAFVRSAGNGTKTSFPQSENLLRLGGGHVCIPIVMQDEFRNIR
jgi:hypothetical protein